MIKWKSQNYYRLLSLEKARKGHLEEFEKFPAFYTITWFLTTLHEIDKAIETLKQIMKDGKEIHPKTNN